MPAKPLTDAADISRRLLAWYDRHRRELPWRAKPGEIADPYRVWLSEVMLQQTTVAAVRPRFEAWIARWPDLASLAAADEAAVMAAWAGLGYYARARNLVRAAQLVAAEHGGRLPDSEAVLRRLPGFGDYTAAAVAAIAFGQRAVVVDANVARVVARLNAMTVAAPAALRTSTDAITPDARAGDFAQAMMDLGATICTPRAPKCLLCPLHEECAGFASGAPETFPAKKAKRAKPQRFGTVFFLWRTPSPAPLPPRRKLGKMKQGEPKDMETTAEILLVRRPASGLLGGMRALPTGPWSDDLPGLAQAPTPADWTILPETVRHGFTHFDLQLTLAVARSQAHDLAADGEWWPVAALGDAGLPTVFRNAADVVIRMMES